MRLLVFITIVAFTSCSVPNADKGKQSEQENKIEPGEWRFSFQIENEELPFNVELLNFESKDPKAIFKNGPERIASTECKIIGDSIYIILPVFDTELRGRIESQTLITGQWINHSRKNYRIPFIAEYNKEFRFTPTKSSTILSKRYHAVFEPNTEDTWNAILIIDQKPEQVKGTFLTETGDYRFLEGNIMNNKLYLSTFDGSHAFLFTADIQGNTLINGTFFSGTHYKAKWSAKADTVFKLRRPEDLTYLKEGAKKFDFRLPDSNGDTVTWADLNLNNKVVIVDIMGSWCPNCMDASVALKELATKYNRNDIEVIPIAFELTQNLDAARERVFKMQSDLGLENKFLFGGHVNKEKAEATFPMLNHIMSYPTLIFIGKDREIKRIYTGFYGPGTGEYYHEFMDDTEGLLDKLVGQGN